MQMGIVHERDTGRVRLSLPKALKKYMEETYQIHENFLYLENKIFRGMDQINRQFMSVLWKFFLVRNLINKTQ